ncbi:MAG: FAD-binding protein [Nitrospirota bacterium]|nr:FAD-binding protein [Nitrospirota bacterium]
MTALSRTEPAPALVDALSAALSRERIRTDRAERLCYGYDATRLSAMPDVVVFPESAAEVAAVLRVANRLRIPVVPRGAGTGFVGGSVPVNGGIVLSLERMNRILEIDRDNLVARVQPGVITADLHRAVEAVGLFYPPDPSSSASCTLGGNAACAATGPRSVKYGGTRDYVLALDAVLPNGDILTNPSRAVKRVAGYDLARLLVGTEGTLGVITGLTLRLLPLPEAVRTLLVAFDDVTAAARAVSDTIARAVVPRACEFMDARSLELVRAHGGVEIPAAARALLVLEVDGSAAEVERDAARVAEVCRAAGAIEVRHAATADEARRVWAARKALSQAMYEVAPTKINEDVVVPRSRLPELVRAVDELATRHDLPIVCFGHAGEGNLHVNIMVDSADAGRMERAGRAVRELFETVVRLEGSVSGEHGIGLTKAAYLPIEVGPLGLDVMRRIKQAFDPLGVLNPGKILPGGEAPGNGPVDELAGDPAGDPADARSGAAVPRR